ncbi:protein kinase [Myxococcaceae bacterium GXIMD 01537]
MEAEASAGRDCASCGEAHEADVPCAPLDARVTIPPRGPDADPLVGTQLGSFRLVRRLGRGGMGTVYLGEHISIGSRVAVKVLHGHLSAYPELVQRFYVEARAVNLIGHENIVGIFDLNAATPRPYLIMEYLEGEPLSARVGAPLPAASWVPLLAQVCEALQATHQRGIVHRDLKPDNVFLVKRAGGPDFVKVLDFGIAKLTAGGVGPVTQAGVIVGTPEYMSPEQALGGQVDGRADLYALGVIAYQLATGQLPFTEEAAAGLLLAHTSRPPPPPRAVCPDVSPVMERVILRALAKTPAERFEHAHALRAALEAALVEEKRAGPSRPAPAPALEWPARVVTRPGAPPERLVCTELSRGGLFLRTEGALPPLFTRLTVTLDVAGAPPPLACEVVSHVTPEQAQQWGRAPGFGVQLVEGTPALRLALERLQRGEPAPAKDPEPAAVETPEVVGLMERLLPRLSGDHYALLGLGREAGMEAVRGRARELLAELGAASREALSRTRRGQVDMLLARVREAAETLASLARRAAYDAGLGNYAGVAWCLGAGLTATQLEALRADFLARRPHAAGAAHIHFLTGAALERGGQPAQALAAYERGLALDPLDLGLQQRYRVLRKALGPRGTPG